LAKGDERKPGHLLEDVGDIPGRAEVFAYQKTDDKQQSDDNNFNDDGEPQPI
jgi:hypothetical protein